MRHIGRRQPCDFHAFQLALLVDKRKRAHVAKERHEKLGERLDSCIRIERAAEDIARIG